jgi:membrane fusion protein (multidrug efflux system)
MNRFFTKAILPAVAILFLAGFLLTACKSKKEQAKQIPQLKVLDIKGMTVPVSVDLVGQATGIPTVEIRARVEGYLQNWSFREGSIVNKGQLLFLIEQDRYINNVKNCEADLISKTAAWEKAKLDVARLKPLLNTKAISQNDYDVAVTTEQQTGAGVESSRANLADAKLNLSYTSITSPITGYIGKVNVNPGNLVGHGESTLLTTVSAVDPIYVDFQMNETDYLYISKYLAEHKAEADALNKAITAYLTLSGNIKYSSPGKIDFIDRPVNPATGTIAMRAVFTNPDGLIKPGNFATVNLVLMERENAVVIPQSATTQIQGKNFAFLVNNENKVSRVPLLLGRNIGSHVTVLSGLTPGSKILLEGFQKFKEEMVIQPVIVQDTFQLPARPQ